MKVSIKHSKDDVAKAAYAFVCNRLNNIRINTVGLTAGSAMLGLYHEIAEGFKRGELDFTGVHTFGTAEFIGMSENNPRSRRQFMEENLFQYINLDTMNIHFPNGIADDPLAECEEYEAEMTYHGGVKLWVLELGRNGHLALNEPGTSLESRTDVTTLTAETIQDNRIFFGNRTEDVPPWAISVGLGTILDADECLVIATGEDKADAVAAMAEGALSASCPASVLQQHKTVYLFVDDAAASKLVRSAHYINAEKIDVNFSRYLEKARRNAGIR